MKRIAILTRTSTINFGTILQNYALQKAIKQLGFKVKTIDDTVPRRIYSKKGKQHSVGFIQSIKEYIYNKYDFFIDIHNNSRYHKSVVKCNRFKKRYIRYYKTNSLNALNREFDVFISGSDQIWSDKAEPEMFPFFMQDFVMPKKYKASYGVSVGAYFNENNEQAVIRYLNDLNIVSVREQSSFEILKKYYKGDIQIDCDPVLLVNRGEWEKLAGKRKVKTNYTFCYFLSYNEWYYDKLKDYIKENSKLDVYLYENIETGFNECKKIFSCSPRDFLNYILYADFIITDSFHAFLFSIIFNKQINVFKRFEDKENCFQNGRIEQMVNVTGMGDWYLDSKKMINTKSMDYSIINPIIRDLRDRSFSNIKEILDYM